MVQIKFSHWFWITATSGLLFSQSTMTIRTQDHEVVNSRRGHRIGDFKQNQDQELHQSQDFLRRSHNNKGDYNKVINHGQGFLEQEKELSTSRSVSVSRVRVEVGENQQKPERRRKKIVKKIKSRKSFLEKIYSRIKEFARVTLASRKVNNDKEIVPKIIKNSFGHNNSENSSQGSDSFDQLNIDNDLESEKTLVNKTNVSETTRENVDSDNDLPRKWTQDKTSNVLSFNEFADGPIVVDSNDAVNGVDNDKIDDIENSNEVVEIVNILDDIQNSNNVIQEEASRSNEARGRSLWQVARPRQGKVIESSNDNHQRSLEASYSSFTQESAVTFDQDSLDSRNGSGLLQWSNVIVLAVSIASAFAIITVLIAAVIYRKTRHHHSRNNCDQFSDIVSTSSRSSASTASTISSTRSSKSNVPDKIDIISFNAEGTLRKQAYNCEDLYSLDSDYFLSSLEDISVQI